MHAEDFGARAPLLNEPDVVGVGDVGLVVLGGVEADEQADGVVGVYGRAPGFEVASAVVADYAGDAREALVAVGDEFIGLSRVLQGEEDRVVDQGRRGGRSLTLLEAQPVSVIAQASTVATGRARRIID